MTGRQTFSLWRAMLIWLGILAFGISFAAAQQDQPLPITVGQNRFAEVTAGNTARFSLEVAQAGMVQFQVFGATEGFHPRLQLISADGQILLDAANPELQATLSANTRLPAAGTYLIEIAGVNAAPGQFMLSLMPGPSAPPPVELVVGAMVEDVVSAQQPLRSYALVPSTQDQPLLLVVRSLNDATAPDILLRSDRLDETVVSGTSPLVGAAYLLQAGDFAYVLEVSYGNSGDDEEYQVCLHAANAPENCLLNELQPSASTSSEPASPPATAQAEGACQLASASGGPVNLRSGPGIGFSIVGGLAAAQTAVVTGQFAVGSWYQVNWNGQTAWVAASVVRLEGDCNQVPNVAPPAPPPPTAQPAPTAAPEMPTPEPPPPQPDAPPDAPPTATTPPTATPPPTVTTAPPTSVPGGSGGSGEVSIDNILGPPLSVRFPDLVPVELTRVGRTTRFDELKVYETYRVTVQNSGVGPAGPFNVRTCSPYDCININHSAGLAAGATNSFELLFVFPLESPSDPMTLTVDTANSVIELNESNNTLRITREGPAS